MLKHWRRNRGLSQLDLSLISDVSARHISFLETGRSRPSAEMVTQLASSLAVPLREVNTMLRAAGFDEMYGEANDPIPQVVSDILERFKQHHEPYPLIVIDRCYRVLDVNKGAAALFAAVLGPEMSAIGLNLARLTFDPNGAQPKIANFDDVGRALLWRIQRELLEDPSDTEMHALLDELLQMPTIDPDWRVVDLQVPADPGMVLHLRHDDVDVRFLTTVTAFQAPQNVAVDHLRVEAWFPYDDVTKSAFEYLLGDL